MSDRVAVLLSDSGESDPVAEVLARHAVRVRSYGRLDELFGEQAPDAIGVLIFHHRGRPNGRALAAIGRMTVEHPSVPMLVVSEAPLSLEVAEYLAGRGVDMIRLESDRVEGELPGAVRRMHERRQRSVAGC